MTRPPRRPDSGAGLLRKAAADLLRGVGNDRCESVAGQPAAHHSQGAVAAQMLRTSATRPLCPSEAKGSAPPQRTTSQSTTSPAVTGTDSRVEASLSAASNSSSSVRGSGRDLRRRAGHHRARRTAGQHGCRGRPRSASQLPFGRGVGEGLGLDSRTLRRHQDPGAARTGVERGQVHHKRHQADVGSGLRTEPGKVRQGVAEQPDGGRALHGDDQQPGVVRRAPGRDPPAAGRALPRSPPACRRAASRPGCGVRRAARR